MFGSTRYAETQSTASTSRLNWCILSNYLFEVGEIGDNFEEGKNKFGDPSIPLLTFLSEAAMVVFDSYLTDWLNTYAN